MVLSVVCRIFEAARVFAHSSVVAEVEEPVGLEAGFLVVLPSLFHSVCSICRPLIRGFRSWDKKSSLRSCYQQIRRFIEY